VSPLKFYLNMVFKQLIHEPKQAKCCNHALIPICNTPMVGHQNFVLLKKSNLHSGSLSHSAHPELSSHGLHAQNRAQSWQIYLSQVPRVFIGRGHGASTWVRLNMLLPEFSDIPELPAFLILWWKSIHQQIQ
jgi:hypothetical protein